MAQCFKTNRVNPILALYSPHVSESGSLIQFPLTAHHNCINLVVCSVKYGSGIGVQLSGEE